MYHRFEENKYPSTNVKIKDFKDHLNLIINEGFSFVNPDDFESELKNKTKKKITFNS